MLTLKHQQAWAAVRGSARVQPLTAPQAGQSVGVVMAGSGCIVWCAWACTIQRRPAAGYLALEIAGQHTELGGQARRAVMGALALCVLMYQVITEAHQILFLMSHIVSFGVR